MPIRPIAWLTFVWMLVAAPLVAQTQSQTSPVVVELFTSQGCSSCPPADALLRELAEREDVIALALHVNYWDYIGWRDVFADPIYTKRQKGYAAHRGERMIYTPQMIINGQDDVVGTKPNKVDELIKEHRARPAQMALSVSRVGDVVEISASAPATAQKMQVQILRYHPLREIEITRGENRGRSLTYANVTQDWTTLTLWDGRAPLEITAPAPGRLPVVVLVQAEHQGPILAAARLQ